MLCPSKTCLNTTIGLALAFSIVFATLSRFLVGVLTGVALPEQEAEGGSNSTRDDKREKVSAMPVPCLSTSGCRRLAVHVACGAPLTWH